MLQLNVDLEGVPGLSSAWPWKILFYETECQGKEYGGSYEIKLLSAVDVNKLRLSVTNVQVASCPNSLHSSKTRPEKLVTGYASARYSMGQNIQNNDKFYLEQLRTFFTPHAYEAETGGLISPARTEGLVEREESN